VERAGGAKIIVEDDVFLFDAVSGLLAGLKGPDSRTFVSSYLELIERIRSHLLIRDQDCLNRGANISLNEVLLLLWRRVVRIFRNGK
jgi:hypothetical protein